MVEVSVTFSPHLRSKEKRMPSRLSPNPDGSQAAPVNIARACVHIDLAAYELERRAGDDVFSRWLPFAGQLHLIGGGLDPSIRAAAQPDDMDVTEHLEKALALLDTVTPAQVPDVLEWIVDLQALRAQIALKGEER
jgi:hypothetical protein